MEVPGRGGEVGVLGAVLGIFESHRASRDRGAKKADGGGWPLVSFVLLQTCFWFACPLPLFLALPSRQPGLFFMFIYYYYYYYYCYYYNHYYY